MPAITWTVEWILKNPAMKVILQKHLKAEFSAENFDFMTMPTPKGDRMARTMYETFIKSDSPKTINISADTKKVLDDLAAANKYGDMEEGLAAARVEIVKLVNRDSLARLKKYMEDIPTTNAKNVKAATNGAKLHAAWMDPILIIGSVSDLFAGQPDKVKNFLRAEPRALGEKRGKVTVKKSTKLPPTKGSLKFTDGLESLVSKFAPAVAEFSKKNVL